MADRDTIQARKRKIINIINDAYNMTDGNGKWCPTYAKIAEELNPELKNADLLSKEEAETLLNNERQRAFQYVQKLSKDITEMDRDLEVVYLKETSEIITDHIIKDLVKKHQDSEYKNKINKLTEIQRARIKKYIRAIRSININEGENISGQYDAVVSACSKQIPAYITYAALASGVWDSDFRITKDGIISEGPAHLRTDGKCFSPFISHFLKEYTICTKADSGVSKDAVEYFFSYTYTLKSNSGFLDEVRSAIYKLLITAQLAENRDGEYCPVGSKTCLLKFIEDAVLTEYESNRDPVSPEKIASLVFGRAGDAVNSTVKSTIVNTLTLSSRVTCRNDGTYIPYAPDVDFNAPDVIGFSNLGNIFDAIADKVKIYVNSYYDKYGKVPSIDEIAAETKMPPDYTELTLKQFPDTFTVKSRDRVLTDYIKAKESEVVMLPILGPIACGRSESVDQSESEGFWPFPKKELDSRKKYYYLKASGDSMKDAGISDGALVLIEITHEANIGDIVVAKDENEGTTLKRYLEDNAGRPYLHPENKETDKNGNLIYQDMYKDEIDIQGKFAGSVVYMFNS